MSTGTTITRHATRPCGGDPAPARAGAGRARRLARNAARPQRAREGARRGAARHARPAADVLRGPDQPAGGPGPPPPHGRAGRRRAAEPLRHHPPRRPPRARRAARARHLRLGRPRLLRRAHRPRRGGPLEGARDAPRGRPRALPAPLRAGRARADGRLVEPGAAGRRRRARISVAPTELRDAADPHPRRDLAGPHRHAEARPRRGPHARLRPAGHQGRRQDARGPRGRPSSATTWCSGTRSTCSSRPATS